MSTYQNSGNSSISENAQYEPLEAMSKQFVEAHKVMEQCKATLARIAGRMDNEHGLVGVCGTEFVTLLRGPWTQKVNIIDEKMIEMSRDITSAMARITSAEKTAAGNVRN